MIFRIAEDLDVSVRVSNNDIVVDEEVRVVMVLMLASDQELGAIGKLG